MKHFYEQILDAEVEEPFFPPKKNLLKMHTIYWKPKYVGIKFIRKKRISNKFTY